MNTRIIKRIEFIKNAIALGDEEIVAIQLDQLNDEELDVIIQNYDKIV